jgi:hypothetical protein
MIVWEQRDNRNFPYPVVLVAIAVVVAALILANIKLKK